MMTKKVSAFLLISLLAGLLAACNRDEAQVEITPQPTRVSHAEFSKGNCPFTLPDWAEFQPQCGFLEVPEDRSDPETSKTIKLAAAVFKSNSETPEPDPILVLIGGPGPVLEWSFQFPYILDDIAENRDIVVVDLRGTGYSEPELVCEGQMDLFFRSFNERSGSPSLLQDHLDLQRSCYQKLKDQEINLDAYTTAANAEDLIDLRMTLGYQQWNIYALGYGTRLAMEVARLDPLGVRSLMMETVMPPQTVMAEERPRNASTVIDLIFAHCGENEQCNQAYPNLKTTFYDLVDELNARPLTVEVNDLNSGASYTMIIDGYRLIETVLSVLPAYLGDNVPQIPRMIFQVKQGKTEQLIEFLRLLPNNVPANESTYVKVNCADDWDFTTKEKIQQAQGGVEPAVAEYFNLSLDVDLAVCDAWKSARPSTAKQEALTSSVPTLILAGEYDWYSPAATARLAAQSMTGATVVEFAGSGEFVIASTLWRDCALKISTAFIKTPQAKPDIACTAEEKEPFWVTLP